MSGPVDRVVRVSLLDSQIPLEVVISAFPDTEEVTLSNLATNYTTTTEVLSQKFSSTGKQKIRIALQISKTGNPTDLLIKYYTHSDTGSTDPEHHQEDEWADLRLTGVAVGTGTYRLSLPAICCAPASQVGVQASGVDGSNYFTITKPRAYLL